MLGKTLFSSALAVIVFAAAPCKAEGVQPLSDISYSAPAQAEMDFTVGGAGRELAYEFAGDREEGALRLFFSRESFAKREKDDILAEELNGISPAAGIRFVMDFSL